MNAKIVGLLFCLVFCHVWAVREESISVEEREEVHRNILSESRGVLPLTQMGYDELIAEEIRCEEALENSRLTRSKESFYCNRIKVIEVLLKYASNPN